MQFLVLAKAGYAQSNSTLRFLGKEGGNRKEDEIFNYLMTLSSNLVGQTGTTQPAAGWKQGSAHYLAEDVYRDVSSWDAFHLLTLFLPNN